MPFGNPKFPSLGLSLLKGGLERNGITSKVKYYNLAFAKIIGLDQYLSLSAFSQFYLGEWVFSQLAFGDAQSGATHDEALIRLIENQEGARRRVRRPELSARSLRDALIAVRAEAHDFVEACVDDILCSNPRILGFSSMFSQNCASLAVARRVKDRLGTDAPTVVFGGSNCEGIMGYTLLKCFPWIDYVCCGEGDQVFIDFAKKFLKGDHPRVPGMVGRRGNLVDPFTTPPPVREMDGLPVPSFGDYFLSLRELKLDEQMEPQLVIETSRGCWWGEVSHCTFCGLNGLTMKYRSKTADRVLGEIDFLTRQWGNLPIQVVDNILNLQFFESLFPKLVNRHTNMSLLFETKSNLNLDNLRMLKDSGVRHIQPGIESLSDEILALMRKGVTGLQNIWLLKRCRELGIAVSWNWLAGFPNEKPAEYERMSKWIPLLHHLQPPLWFGSIHLDRFSPLFNFQKSYGIVRVRPALPYKLIYPLDERDLHDLAYYFDFEYEDGREPERYEGILGMKIREWMREWKIPRAESPSKPFLMALLGKITRPVLALIGAPVPAMFGAPILGKFSIGAFLFVWDTRTLAYKKVYLMTGLEAKLLLYTDNVRVRDSVLKHFRELGYGYEEIQDAISGLVMKGLMVVDSERCLGIATDINLKMILARLFGLCLQMMRRIRGSVREDTEPARESTGRQELELELQIE